MARPKEPIAIIKAKGKKHLTKEEIEKRESEEVKVPLTNVKSPSYLKDIEKREFNTTSKKLVSIGIMTELDVDSLGRYILAKQLYLKYTDILKGLLTEENTDIDYLSKIQNMQDKVFKQCQSSARDLGLTISSRCKLVIPQEKEDDDDDDL